MQKRNIETIRPYERNAKKHPQKQITKIADSIREFGFNQPVVVDKQGVIIVGHGRYYAAKELKLAEVPCLELDLTDEQASAYRLADNKLNESDWNMDLVIAELKELSTPMIDLTGFSADLLLEDEDKDDAVPGLPAIAKSQRGDIYELGNHRVLCGDSTDKADVSLLMNGVKADMVFTDPPYNVDYEGKTKDALKIVGDKENKESFYQFLLKICENLVDFCSGGIYICFSTSEIDSLKKAFEQGGGHWQSFIIWVKNNFAFSRTDYQNTYEPILYGWPAGVKNHYFTDSRNLSNVWEDLSDVKTEYSDGHTIITFKGFKVKIPGQITAGQIIRKQQKLDIFRHNKPTRSDEHPTMKPVALVQEAIVNSSVAGDIVLDLFLGSGSTLIASEKSARICYGMELDPHYVDVIVQRYIDFTGDNNIKKNGEKIAW